MHVVWLVLVCLHEVGDHVNYELAIVRILGNPDVRLCASKHRSIVRSNFFNLFKHFGLPFLGHLTLVDSHSEGFLITLLRVLLYRDIVLDRVFELNCRGSYCFFDRLLYKVIYLRRWLFVLLLVRRWQQRLLQMNVRLRSYNEVHRDLENYPSRQTNQNAHRDFCGVFTRVL